MQSTEYIGTIREQCDWHVHVDRDGIVAPLDPGYRHGVNHSPCGFAWGYGGSGPAQLAFAILADHAGPEIARRHYQRFKWRVIARLDGDAPFRLSAAALAPYLTEEELP